MTYPSPYQPPQGGIPNFDFYYQQQPDYLAPARRAANMMIAIGVLALLASLVVFAGMGELMKDERFLERMRQVPDASLDLIETSLKIFGGLLAFAGIVFIALSAGVRRGNKGFIIFSLVLSLLAALIFLLWLIGSVVQVATIGPIAAGGVCITLVPLVMLVLQTFWLGAAMGAADRLAASQYAMQYW